MLKLWRSLPLSRMFSGSDIPFLDYRLSENVFCKYLQATNDARACTAYDARISSLGIGIKTFILKQNGSFEKIAKFNKLKTQLDPLKGLELARKLGEFTRQHPPVVSGGEQTHTKLQQENCALAVIQKLEQEIIILRNNIDALSKQIVALKENNIAYQDTIAILRDKQEENSTILKGVLDENKALKDRNTLLHKKIKLYISLFYAILLLVILWIIAKVVHRIKRFTFRHHKSLETDFIEPQTMDSKKDEEITIVDSSADDAKELKCPRCGWKYNPGDKVCKNCKTIF